MTEENRFTTTDDVQGFTLIRKAPAEPTPHEKPDTQGTITDHTQA
jgi:hypothetical protein